jgi:hypothetical protein
LLVDIGSVLSAEIVSKSFDRIVAFHHSSPWLFISTPNKSQSLNRAAHFTIRMKSRATPRPYDDQVEHDNGIAVIRRQELSSPCIARTDELRAVA